jgi:hypothetical protein
LASDDYGLFRLYSAAIPDAVRYVEGLTLGEWQEARDSFKTELVYERGDSLLAWVGLGVEEGWGYFDVRVHPSAEDSLEEIITSALALLRGKPAVLSLVPEFQLRLRRLLEGMGFEPVAAFCVLVKQLRVRVPEPEHAPMPARGLGPALPFGGRYAQRDHP